MIITMHDSERYGYLAVNGLTMSDDFVARKCNVTITEYQQLLHELEQYSVFSRTSDGVIYSRKMVRNQADRKKNAKRQEKFKEKKGNASVTPTQHPSSSSSSSSHTKDKDTATKSASVPSTSAPSVVDNGLSATGKSSRMPRPTLEELTTYLRGRNSTIDAEAFLAFYESNGWKVGRNPMKSWHGAVRTWEQRNPQDRRIGEVQHWREIQLPSKIL